MIHFRLLIVKIFCRISAYHHSCCRRCANLPTSTRIALPGSIVVTFAERKTGAIVSRMLDVFGYLADVFGARGEQQKNNNPLRFFGDLFLSPQEFGIAIK